jgi:hypothetical protein
MKGYNNTYIIHRVMHVILVDVATVQLGRDHCLKKKVPLKVGDRWIVLDIACPLLFIISDGKQPDHLCCCCCTEGHRPSHHRQQRSCE